MTFASSASCTSIAAPIVAPASSRLRRRTRRARCRSIRPSCRCSARCAQSAVRVFMCSRHVRRTRSPRGSSVVAFGWPASRAPSCSTTTGLHPRSREPARGLRCARDPHPTSIEHRCQRETGRDRVWDASGHATGRSRPGLLYRLVCRGPVATESGMPSGTLRSVPTGSLIPVGIPRVGRDQVFDTCGYTEGRSRPGL